MSATRLRMVLEDDDRVGAMGPPDSIFAVLYDSGLAFRFSFSLSKKLKKVQTGQESSSFS